LLPCCCSRKIRTAQGGGGGGGGGAPGDGEGAGRNRGGGAHSGWRVRWLVSLDLVRVPAAGGVGALRAGVCLLAGGLGLPGGTRVAARTSPNLGVGLQGRRRTWNHVWTGQVSGACAASCGFFDRRGVEERHCAELSLRVSVEPVPGVPQPEERALLEQAQESWSLAVAGGCSSCEGRIPAASRPGPSPWGGGAAVSCPGGLTEFGRTLAFWAVLALKRCLGGLGGSWGQASAWCWATCTGAAVLGRGLLRGRGPRNRGLRKTGSLRTRGLRSTGRFAAGGLGGRLGQWLAGVGWRCVRGEYGVGGRAAVRGHRLGLVGRRCRCVWKKAAGVPTGEFTAMQPSSRRGAWGPEWASLLFSSLRRNLGCRKDCSQACGSVAGGVELSRVGFSFPSGAFTLNVQQKYKSVLSENNRFFVGR